MPTYMDRHELPVVTPEAVAEAHVLDLGTQGAFGVRFLTYWLDSPHGYVFCLAEAPDEEAVISVHSEAHGLIPNRVFEVDPHTVASFLGAIVEPEPGTPWAASAFRTIMFTDLVGSTALISTLGDVGAKNLVLDLDASVRAELAKLGGTAVDHTGDGIMASFHSPRDAIACAISIQRSIAAREHRETPVQIRIGLAAGEPITEDGRLFGAAVNLASRICAACGDGAIWVTSGVRELALGKGFTFVERGEATLKGFDEPIRLYEVPWTI
jgi:class 3 adenylate cyclase